MKHDDIFNQIQILADKAARTNDSQDAMRFSQAACNLSNAACNLTTALSAAKKAPVPLSVSLESEYK